MKRLVATLVAVVVVASAATGVLIWRMTSSHESEFPEISAYSRGHSARWGRTDTATCSTPTKCSVFEEQGELPVSEREPVQLSVPEAIGKAPWVLLRQYEDSDAVLEEFRPDSRLAVTIPTVDPRRGKLNGIAVLLPTLIRLDGEEVPAPHAEWSVRTVWP